tara:strand:- start:659 stop:1087 length:429 start_codon:yes stop_codon:yes gene_type:complete
MSIEIYYNLHKKVFSIRNKGKVIDHATSVTVLDPKFVVQPAGRAKVIKDKVKNVHAFVRTKGLWTTENVDTLSKLEPYDDLSSYYLKKLKNKLPLFLEEVSYNPYRSGTFVLRDSGDAIHEADIAYLSIDKQNRPYITISRT